MNIIVPRPEHMPRSQNDLPDEVYYNIWAADQLASIVGYMLSYTNEFHKEGKFDITLTNTGGSEVRRRVTEALAEQGWEATYELEKYQQPLLTLRPLDDL
ncbi:hypothetical protein PR1_107 [Providencia phage vB_PreS_PR1]|uniref:Uncharacterized protein n=1 Tax=Providencia phage vB_PreS_PR1 TaxID=1931407 RepID=A0A1S6KV70_9CAUD|nr:hypothetical protein FDH30_gp107 [Providencia phage vB_PreS_PR1]AQT25315.1 hypothetical protein PR1_107 [Providencia phage vB_PreS_PR1]